MVSGQGQVVDVSISLLRDIINRMLSARPKKVCKNVKGLICRLFQVEKRLAKILGAVFHSTLTLTPKLKDPIFKCVYGFGLKMLTPVSVCGFCPRMLTPGES